MMNEEQLRRLSDVEVQLNKAQQQVAGMSKQLENAMNSMVIKSELQKITDYFNKNFIELTSSIIKEFKEHKEQLSDLKAASEVQRSNINSLTNVQNKFSLDDMERKNLLDAHQAQHGLHAQKIAKIEYDISDMHKISANIDILTNKMNEFTQTSSKVNGEVKKRIDDNEEQHRRYDAFFNNLTYNDNAISRKLENAILEGVKEQDQIRRDTAKIISDSVKPLQYRLDSLPKVEPQQFPDIAQMLKPLQDQVNKALELAINNNYEPVVTNRRIDQIFKRLDKLGA